MRRRPRAHDLLALKTWGSAALVWLGLVLAALAAARHLPGRQGQMRQLAADAATWGVAGNAVAWLTAALWQRRAPWGEAGEERAHLTLAFGNAAAAGWATANALLPMPLLAAALPPLLALALAAGCAAAALAAAFPQILGRHRYG